LRCIDIIDGTSRHNTYEDIYKNIKPLEEDEPDPMIDPRPVRSYEGGRRLSGVLPEGFLSNLKDGMQTVKEDINELKRKNGSKKTKGLESIPKPFRHAKVSHGLKPDLNHPSFDDLHKKLAVIEGSSDESDDDLKIDIVKPADINDVVSIPSDDGNEYGKPDFHSSIDKNCFIDRKLRVKEQKDAYNLYKFRPQEHRTYLSSERYLAKWEDYFEEFLKVIKKSDLAEESKVETPAIVVEELKDYVSRVIHLPFHVTNLNNLNNIHLFFN